MIANELIDTKALYFRLYRSYLLRSPDLNQNYDMLLDHYNQYPNSFSVLSKKDLLRIKQIQKDIQENRHSLFSFPIDLNNDIPEALKREKSSKTHKEFCKAIAKDPYILEPYTGHPEFVNLEHPTIYGPIDVIIYSNKCAYIIEIKTEAADHSIIGQVMKYYIGMSLKLSLGFFDDVKIICLCPGYDRMSYSNLKRIGAQCLILKDNPISIEKAPF